MNKAYRGFTLTLCSLLVSLAMPLAHSSNASYDSLTEINSKVVFLGDVLTIDAGWCWPSKKPSHSLAKKRLEIYKSGRWQSVGKVVFLKSADCEKKTPYIQKFQWEVDEFGILGPDKVSGVLRLRNSAVKPTIYSKVNVYESEAALAKATEKKIDEAGQILGCLIRGGEWNSLAGYCVLPPG
jgi:hypothetical protein